MLKQSFDEIRGLLGSSFFKSVDAVAPKKKVEEKEVEDEEHPCPTKELVAIAVPTLLGLADGHCQCGCFTPVVQLCNRILVVSGYCCVYISSTKGTGSSCKAAVPVPARRGDDCLSACLPSNKQIYRLPSRVTDKLYPFLNLLSRILVIPTLTLK